jgi:hypothetical protein
MARGAPLLEAGKAIDEIIRVALDQRDATLLRGALQNVPTYFAGRGADATTVGRIRFAIEQAQERIPGAVDDAELGARKVRREVAGVRLALDEAWRFAKIATTETGVRPQHRARAGHAFADAERVAAGEEAP